MPYRFGNTKYLWWDDVLFDREAFHRALSGIPNEQTQVEPDVDGAIKQHIWGLWEKLDKTGLSFKHGEYKTVCTDIATQLECTSQHVENTLREAYQALKNKQMKSKT